MLIKITGRLLACGVFLLPLANTHAEEVRQSTIATIVEEVVVTAARRKNVVEDAQSVPISVSAFTEGQLDAMQFANLQDITSRVPNANAEHNGTYTGFINFNIRGMGTRGSALSDEPTVGVFIDGVYQGISAGGMLDTFDLESVEILRGPQGTLFGRNVTGGAVLMRTTAPKDEFHAKVKLSAGNYGAQGVAGLVTGPLVEDQLLGKFAFFYNQRDDYIDNINKGNPLAPNADDLGEKDQLAFRGALTWRGDAFEATLRAEHMVNDEDPLALDNTEGRFLSPDGINALFGALSPNGVVAPEYDDAEKHGGDVGAVVPRTELDSASLEVTWDIGDKATLQSITAWRDFSQEDMQQDFDNSLVPLFEIWEHEITQDQFSQEFVFNTVLNDSVSMTAGLYYFQQEVTNNDFRISGGGFGGTGAHILYEVDQEVLGLFASFDWALTENLNLTLAGRYTQEEKDATISNVNAFAVSGGVVGCSADGAPAMLVSGINPKTTIDFSSCTPSYSGDEDWANFSPKVGLQYFFSDNTQAYFSYSQGVRSGGFSTRGQFTSDPLFDEESVDAYELGVKHDFDNGIRLNAGVFHNTFDDLQENIFLSVETGEQITRNAAEATIRGAELETLIPIGQRLLIQGSAGYVDAKYDDYTDGVEDFSDKRLRSVPQWQRDIGVIFDQPLGDTLNLIFRGSYHYRGDFHNTANNMGYVSPARETFDASLSLEGNNGRWRVTAYGKNLTDQTTGGQATDVSLWVVTGGYIPRTYGVEFVYEMD